MKIGSLSPRNSRRSLPRWSLLSGRAGLEEIVFLYVVDRDEVGFNFGAGFDNVYKRELEEKARLHFLDWEAGPARHGVATRQPGGLGSRKGKSWKRRPGRRPTWSRWSRHPLRSTRSIPTEVDGGAPPFHDSRFRLPPGRAGGDGVSVRARLFPPISRSRAARSNSWRPCEGSRRVEVVFMSPNARSAANAAEVAELETADRERLDAVSGELREMGIDTAPHLSPASQRKRSSRPSGTRLQLRRHGNDGAGRDRRRRSEAPPTVIELADIPVVILVPPGGRAIQDEEADAGSPLVQSGCPGGRGRSSIACLPPERTAPPASSGWASSPAPPASTRATPPTPRRADPPAPLQFAPARTPGGGLAPDLAETWQRPIR